MTTVKELINILLEQPMSDEIFIKDNKTDSELHDVSINVRPQGRTLGALFG